MSGNPICTSFLRQQSSGNRARMRAATRITQGRYMVDIYAEAKMFQFYMLHNLYLAVKKLKEVSSKQCKFMIAMFSRASAFLPPFFGRDVGAS
jgi:hypothetical protein